MEWLSTNSKKIEFMDEVAVQLDESPELLWAMLSAYRASEVKALASTSNCDGDAVDNQTATTSNVDSTTSTNSLPANTSEQIGIFAAQ